MSNYPQKKFTAPNISGKWNYWVNNQNFELSAGGLSEITDDKGIIDIEQDNLFFNYENKEKNVTRMGVFIRSNNCINGKLNTQWSGYVVNNGDDATLNLYPYSYKNGKPTKMTSTNIAPGPLGSGPVYVRTTYYEKI